VEAGDDDRLIANFGRWSPSACDLGRMAAQAVLFSRRNGVPDTRR